MYKIEFYVPSSHLESVKEALFAAGAGRIGKYDRCCWQIEGLGQFRPLEGSDPHIGSQGQTEQINEWKVEMVCEDSLTGKVLEALYKSHPYEEPAFNIVQTAEKSMFL